MYSILIIDSDKNSSGPLREFLKSEGYKVYYSDKARSGLQKAIEKKPDLVLMELVFSDEDGFNLLRDLKSHINLLNTHLIIFSQKNDVFDKVLALELGADDYVAKPASFREIAARIRSQFRYPRAINKTV